MKKSPIPLDMLTVDRSLRDPLHRQLVNALRKLILSGALQKSERLPSIRAMSAQLKLSRNTVVAAYDQLAAEGFIVSKPNAGVWVADTGALGKIEKIRSITPNHPAFSNRGRLMTSQPRVRSLPGNVSFHPGTPETSLFPFKTWGQILRRKSTSGGEDLFGYHSLGGLRSLRENIAHYLASSRGVRCSADQIIITTGGQAALDILARILLDNGDLVWIEEPGFLGARSVFEASGARLVNLPVDKNGWHISAEPFENPKMIYLTPSCQHPLGVTMSLEKRLQFLEIAHSNNSWIIEDDYDGEYTFRGDPLPAMQGLIDNEKVIYVGTFAKTLFPGLRIGYFIAPKEIASAAKTVLNFTGQYPPLILQATLAEFMSRGYFFTHLNKMRRLYLQRRSLFLELADSHIGNYLKPLNGRTGIQIACLASCQMNDLALARLALNKSINLAPLSLYYRSHPAEHGFLMGYAGVSEESMRSSFRLLEELLDGYNQSSLVEPGSASHGLLND